MKQHASMKKADMDKDSKSTGFIEAIHLEKHDRLARNALHEIFTFYDQMSEEMQRLMATAPQSAQEQQLLESMQRVDNCYHSAMDSLRETNNELQHNALVRFSDAIIDLMTLLNRQRIQ